MSAPTEPTSGGDATEAGATGIDDLDWADDDAEPDAGQPLRPDAGQAPGEADEVGASSIPGGGSVADPPGDGAQADPADHLSVEVLVQDLERVTAERDQYLDASRRLQAEFENYKKAVAKRELEARERANESLVSEILPVLDACDGALASGATDVAPVRTSLLDALTKQGLGRIDDLDAAFDPERHEAVMHEPNDDGDGPVVAEVMRAGYSWKGRVVRPAMVRVRG